MNGRLRTSAAAAFTLLALMLTAGADARPGLKAPPVASTIRGNVDVVRKTPDGKFLDLMGWAADLRTGSVQKVEIRLNDKPVGVAQLGLARPDVAQTLRRQDLARSGWTAKVDLTRMPRGIYRVSAYAFSGGASAPLAMGKVEFRLP